MSARLSSRRGLFEAADAEKARGHREEPKDEMTPDKDEAEDDMIRITAYLTLNQLEHLDDDRRKVRRKHRTVLDRTAILRGLAEGYRLSGLDLASAGITTEEEVARRVASLLSGRKE